MSLGVCNGRIKKPFTPALAPDAPFSASAAVKIHIRPAPIDYIPHSYCQSVNCHLSAMLCIATEILSKKKSYLRMRMMITLLYRIHKIYSIIILLVLRLLRKVRKSSIPSQCHAESDIL